MGSDVWRAIIRKYQEQANAEIDGDVDGMLDARSLDPDSLSLRPGALIPILESLSLAELRVRDRILTHLEGCLREAPFETGDGPLSLPAHEPLCDHLFCNVPRGFERARDALMPLQARVDACAPITCFLEAHAPDCECATL